MLYLTDMIQVPIALSLINMETKKLTTSVQRNTQIKFFKGNVSKKSLHASHVLFFQKYRPRNPINPMMIISFHIQMSVQNDQSKPSL